MDDLLDLSWVEKDALVALMDRIIPGDDFPSASANGVLNYIARILDTDMRARQDWYKSGLAALNSEAEIRHNCPFANLTPMQQDELIRLLEKRDTMGEWPVSSAEFVRVSVNLVSEGYYAAPANGGNPDEASWRMIGFAIAEGIRLPVECAQ